MPWSPAQIRLFGAQMRRGELSKKEFDRRVHEGTRKDVNKSGHVKKKKSAKKKRMKSVRKGGHK